MVDASAIGGAVASLKTAAEIASTLIKINNLTEVQGKVLELQGAIDAAQKSALSANIAQFELLEEKRRLEKQIADLEAWGSEKQRYKLTDVGRGSLAFVLKPEEQGSEPPHAICSNCYQHQRKSYLIPVRKSGPWGLRIYTCASCQAEVPMDASLFGGPPPSTGGGFYSAS